MANNTRKKRQFDPQPDELHEEVGQRVLAYARQKYPHGVRRRTAEDAGCSYETARTWFDRGQGPGLKHLLQLMADWGPHFIRFVLEPVDQTIATAPDLSARTEKNIRGTERNRKEFERVINGD